MNRSTPCIAALLLILVALPASADRTETAGTGVGFDLSGYYRLRYDNFFEDGWILDADSDWTEYMDHRFRLSPTLTVNDRIIVRAQIDMLRNALLGQNRVLRDPMLAIERVLPGEDEDYLIRDVELAEEDFETGSVFSEMVSSTDRNLDEVPSIELTRVWGDVVLPFGRLRFGRQPVHFGMGIYANDGNGLDDDFGDTYDRIQFTTQVGPVAPSIGYDRLAEGDITSGWTDIHQFFLDVHYAGNPVSAAGYFTYRGQNSTDSRIFFYGLWLKALYRGFTAEAEALMTQGSSVQVERSVVDELEDAGLPTGDGGGRITIDAYIAALRLRYDTLQWAVGLEGGVSSPADSDPAGEFDPAAAAAIARASDRLAGDPDDAGGQVDFIDAVVRGQAAFGKSISTFAFDPDYNVDLLLWEQLMGGAVRNGIYARLWVQGTPFSWLLARVTFIQSWINEAGKGADGEDAANDLGSEIDVELEFSMARRFRMNLQLGYLMTGGYFDDVYEDVTDPYTFQVNFAIDF